MPPPVDAGEDAPQETSNLGARADIIGARADIIRAAVAWIAEREAERKAIGAEITEYKQKHIKVDLGFKLADFNAICRVSQLDVEDRDKLLDTLREGFEALGIGEQGSFLGALDETAPRRAAPQSGNGQHGPIGKERSPIAWETGFADGLAGNVDHAARWPAGDLGHVDYHAGHDEGAKQHERSAALSP